FWPASVFKISLVKTFALHVYALMVLHSGDYASWRPLLARAMFALRPIVFVLPIVLYVLVRRARDRSFMWGPLLIFGALYLASMARTMLGPRYAVPSMAPLACLFGAALDELGAQARRWIAACAVLAFVVLTPRVGNIEDGTGIRADM